MSEPAPGITVCICTYNGAARIGDVVGALGRQTDRSARWEVLVVDNASTDRTGAAAEEALNAQMPGRGRVVQEPRPGLMHARQRATRDARGDVLAFLDDDNIPAPDYIEALGRVVAAHPDAGVWGGKVYPEWIGEPTPVGRAIASFALAVCDRGDTPFAYGDVTGGPAGAGMVVLRSLMERVFEESSLAGRVTGRTGTALTGGEDTAIVIRAHQLGYAVRYEPSLIVAHRIPAARTDPAYLLRLYEGIGRGQAAMRPLFDPKARNRALAALIALKEGARWVKGNGLGPSSSLRREFGPLAREVHALQQRQVYGRFSEGLKRAFSRA